MAFNYPYVPGQQPPPQQPPQQQQGQYFGTIAPIMQAYQNDPRTKLANSMLANGTSTSPVAGGKYAVGDGLARIASALGGAFVEKAQNKKYAAREDQYFNGKDGKPGIKDIVAAALGGENPAMANPSTANPSGMVPGMAAGAPPQPQSPPPGAPPPIPPQAPPMGAGGTPQQPSMGGMAPPMAATGGIPPAFAPSNQPPGSQPGLTALGYYRTGIRPIEGGTDPQTGAFRTSPKGAVGPGQIMPGTGPEAARLAGLPWDTKRFRSDTQYNDALGAAYYQKQLQDFGDPVVAAAAYNAGPGRVRRALRQAQSKGGDWAAYVPDETKQYVKNFAAKIGDVNVANPTNAVASGPVPGPQVQNVPEALTDPGAPPSTPQAPNAVKSNKLALAQQLLASGNPDFVTLGQQYLNEGLDEQFKSNTNTNDQQFQLGKTGYAAGLNDWQNSRNDVRSQKANERATAITENYQSGENALNRQFNRQERIGGENFQGGEADKQRQFTGGQAALDRNATRSNLEYSNQQDNARTQYTVDGKKETAQDALQAKRSQFFNTAGGQKLVNTLQQEINDNESTIGQFKQFKDLNSQTSTGGTNNVPFAGALRGAFDKNYSTMDAISKKLTLAGLGGSLGVAISDADREFIGKTTVSPGNLKEANDMIADASIAALQRKSEYNTQYAYALADGNQADFAKNWPVYARTVPIVQYKDGKPIVSTNMPSYTEWLNSRPKYDASGKKVQ